MSIAPLNKFIRSDASTTTEHMIPENSTDKCEISNSENNSDANHRNRTFFFYIT